MIISSVTVKVMVISFKATFNNIQFYCWRLPQTTSHWQT